MSQQLFQWVIATVSPENFERVHGVGATAVFHNNDPAIDEKLFTAFHGTKCVGAFDTIGTNTARCVAIVARLEGGHVTGTLDSPSVPTSGVCSDQGYVGITP